MSHATYTDRDIPIICGECPGQKYIDGVPGMMEHLILKHHYDVSQAKHFAEQGAEKAHEEQIEQMAAYYKADAEEDRDD